MKTFTKTLLVTLIAAATTMLGGCQTADLSIVVAKQAQGQKLDSGLGDLPHYRDWSDKTGKAMGQPVLTTAALSVDPADGQKLDSGLGDLPHYRNWSDKTGKDVGEAVLTVARSTAPH